MAYSAVPLQAGLQKEIEEEMQVRARHLVFLGVFSVSHPVLSMAQASIAAPPPVLRSDPFPARAPDPTVLHMRAQQIRRMTEQNHLRLLQDSDRIVSLSKELEANLAQHINPTSEDTKKMQEIEKLARGIRERMAQ